MNTEKSPVSPYVLRGAMDFIKIAVNEGGASIEQVYAMLDAFDPGLKDALVMALLTGDTMSNKLRLELDPNYNGPRQVITAIKAVRGALGIGLKESKDMSDAANEGRPLEVSHMLTAEQLRDFRYNLRDTGYRITP